MNLHSASFFTTPQDPSCLRGAVTLSKSLPLEEETYSAPSGACTLRYNDPSEGHCDCLRRSGKRCRLRFLPFERFKGVPFRAGYVTKKRS